MRYRSVVGKGRIVFVEERKEKRFALKCLVNRYSPGYRYEPSEREVESVEVLKILVEEVTGKKSEAI